MQGKMCDSGSAQDALPAEMSDSGSALDALRAEMRATDLGPYGRLNYLGSASDLSAVEKRFARLDKYIDFSWLSDGKGESEAPVFVCLDFVTWDKDPDIVLELGIATLDTAHIPPDDRDHYANWDSKVKTQHIIIQEYAMLSNRPFYRRHRRDWCYFAKSVMRTLKEAGELLKASLTHGDRPVVILAPKFPCAGLYMMEIIEKFRDERPGRTALIHPQALAGYCGKHYANKPRFLKIVGIYTHYLSNPGNLAFCMMAAFFGQITMYKYGPDDFKNFVRRINRPF